MDYTLYHVPSFPFLHFHCSQSTTHIHTCIQTQLISSLLVSVYNLLAKLVDGLKSIKERKKTKNQMQEREREYKQSLPHYVRMNKKINCFFTLFAFCRFWRKPFFIIIIIIVFISVCVTRCGIGRCQFHTLMCAHMMKRCEKD